jgi:chromosome segregation ATPase
LKKDVEVSIREKENVVMRFAILEKNVLDVKLSKENSEKKIKDLNREIELLNGKIKGAATEKTRICNMLDAKCHELKTSQKEVDKLKADLSGLETKFKWNSVKLKQEIELKFTAEKKVEELTQEVNQLKMHEIAKAKEEIEIERNMLAGKLSLNFTGLDLFSFIALCSTQTVICKST